LKTFKKIKPSDRNQILNKKITKKLIICKTSQSGNDLKQSNQLNKISKQVSALTVNYLDENRKRQFNNRFYKIKASYI